MNEQSDIKLNTISSETQQTYAIASLVCGILPFIGIGGIVLSIIAWILGARALNGSSETYMGMAKAGKICGIINTVIRIVIIFLLVIYFCIVFNFGMNDSVMNFLEPHTCSMLGRSDINYLITLPANTFIS